MQLERVQNPAYRYNIYENIQVYSLDIFKISIKSLKKHRVVNKIKSTPGTDPGVVLSCLLLTRFETLLLYRQVLLEGCC